MEISAVGVTSRQFAVTVQELVWSLPMVVENRPFPNSIQHRDIDNLSASHSQCNGALFLRIGLFAGDSSP